MAFLMRTSLHGRRLGLSSTGGLISAANSTGGHNSSAFNMSAQMWGPAMVQTVSSGGAAVSNSGLTIVSSLSTGGMAALVLGAPTKGVFKTITFVCSASLLTLETSATSILFAGGGSGSSLLTAIGSTILNIGSAGFPSVFGVNLILVGCSTTIWAVMSRSSSNLVSS